MDPFDESDLCECRRPDEIDNPHRHTLDVACLYFGWWQAAEERLHRRGWLRRFVWRRP